MPRRRHELVVSKCQEFFLLRCPNKDAIPELWWFDHWVGAMRRSLPSSLDSQAVIVATMFFLHKYDNTLSARRRHVKDIYYRQYSSSPMWAASKTELIGMFMGAAFLAAQILEDWGVEVKKWLGFFQEQPYGVTKTLIIKWQKRICETLNWEVALFLETFKEFEKNLYENEDFQKRQ